MTTKSLFESPLETKKQEKKIRHFNKYDLISYLIKTIRLGEKHKAVEILHTMLQEKIPELYIARKMTHLAVEDCIGGEVFVLAKQTHDRIRDNGSEVNGLSRLILILCESEKFWETSKESYWETERIKIRERIKKCYKKGEKPFELPEFVRDIYTSRGKAKSKKGERIDLRFSGVLQGGLWMRVQYIKYGKLDPSQSKMEDAYGPHLKKCMEEQLSIDEYMEKHKIGIDNFFISLPKKSDEIDD